MVRCVIAAHQVRHTEVEALCVVIVVGDNKRPSLTHCWVSPSQPLSD